MSHFGTWFGSFFREACPPQSALVDEEKLPAKGTFPAFSEAGFLPGQQFLFNPLEVSYRAELGEYTVAVGEELTKRFAKPEDSWGPTHCIPVSGAFLCESNSKLYAFPRCYYRCASATLEGDCGVTHTEKSVTDANGRKWVVTAMDEGLVWHKEQVLCIPKGLLISLEVPMQMTSFIQHQQGEHFWRLRRLTSVAEIGKRVRMIPYTRFTHPRQVRALDKFQDSKWARKIFDQNAARLGFWSYDLMVDFAMMFFDRFEKKGPTEPELEFLFHFAQKSFTGTYRPMSIADYGTSLLRSRLTFSKTMHVKEFSKYRTVEQMKDFEKYSTRSKN